jgi:hypothetical protein
MRSPEAARVIISYKQDQYQTAIDCMKHLGSMKAELAKIMLAKEKVDRLQLEIMEREERYRVEIESLKREREEYKKHFELKMLELQANIERQTKSQGEMKRSVDEQREQLVKSFDDKFEELLRENEERIKILQKEYEEKIEKIRNKYKGRKMGSCTIS